MDTKTTPARCRCWASKLLNTRYIYMCAKLSEMASWVNFGNRAGPWSLFWIVAVAESSV